MPSVLTNLLFLEEPQRWVYRLSGQRDATYIEIDWPGHIDASILRRAATNFFYGDTRLGRFSPGAGQYLNTQGVLTTRITYNIGLQEQDQSEFIHRGFELFRRWEDRLEQLVRGNIRTEIAPEVNAPVAASTYSLWAGILGDVIDWRRLSIYLEEPVEGRLKSIDDVMRYLYDAWQSLLLIEHDELRLICLLDEPDTSTSPTPISSSRAFDLAHDPNETMEIGIIDRAGYFRLPAGSEDAFPRRIPTLRLNEAEATLEITLQRLREGAHTRQGMISIPLPATYEGLQAIRPGQGVTVDGVAHWVTEATLNFPEETATLGLYRAGST